MDDFEIPEAPPITPIDVSDAASFWGQTFRSLLAFDPPLQNLEVEVYHPTREHWLMSSDLRWSDALDVPTEAVAQLDAATLDSDGGGNEAMELRWGERRITLFWRVLAQPAGYLRQGCYDMVRLMDWLREGAAHEQAQAMREQLDGLGMAPTRPGRPRL